jgi:hypothetical protein
MLYRTFLAVLSCGSIAIEAFVVSAPLLCIGTEVDGREALHGQITGQAEQPGDDGVPNADEVLGMSSVAVTGTASLVQLVLAATALVRSRFVDGDGFTDTFPTSAGS